MRISLIAISIIIALQATSFIHGSYQRYVYHHSLNQYLGFIGPYINWKFSESCFDFHEQVRFIVIAFMYSGALLLLTGEAVWPAFVAQLFWVAFESHLCTDRSLNNIRYVGIQLLILFILAVNMQCCQNNKNKKAIGDSNQQLNQKVGLSRPDSINSQSSSHESIRSFGSADSSASSKSPLDKSLEKKQSPTKNAPQSKNEATKKQFKTDKQIKNIENIEKKKETAKNIKKRN